MKRVSLKMDTVEKTEPVEAKLRRSCGAATPSPERISLKPRLMLHQSSLLFTRQKRPLLVVPLKLLSILNSLMT